MIEADTKATQPQVLLVTGPSGAGRSTAVNALEDLGFEVIDNLPLSLLAPLLEARPPRPLALGLDARNRDFSADALGAAIDTLTTTIGDGLQVVYLDASDDVLLRRFSETRRRHPLANEGAPILGIQSEKQLLSTVRERADVLIDTTNFSPHALRAEMDKHFAKGEGRFLGITVQSFSYKRGLPRGLDYVFDCRFLRNPHWDKDLRPLDGRDARVAQFVAGDARFAAFSAAVTQLVDTALPGHKEEGRSHVAVGFGCSGGRHRSVMMAESLAASLAQKGWQVSKRHRELERKGTALEMGQVV